MTRVRPADVRFYVDADLAGLGKLLVRLRPDVTYPGIRVVLFTPGNGRPAPLPRQPPSTTCGFRWWPHKVG